MPSLKEYRDRIASVKSTKKITSAMKMVAASKLKKAQDQAEASQPYASAMAEMMSRVAAGVIVTDASPRLLIGTGKDDVHLLVVVTADRGLCGGFNGNLARKAREEILHLEAEGKTVKLLLVGRKGRDVLKRNFENRFLKTFTGIAGKTRIEFADADQVTQYILEAFDAGEFDKCSLVYNEFKSVLTQTPSIHQLIPFSLPEVDTADIDTANEGKHLDAPYTFEPEEDAMLEELLPKNLGVQIYRALLDSAAGEQAARMTAMDNATRNAGDRINGLTLEYNRARQAAITKELIEIISGAEAV
ncbi:MAG TPA: F0F1 ATP synthase subunit gamma [Micavibrio sp.]|nr:F0F1 ATP synthase subunit gamma [Micavibrio sp.]HIL28201.1 F0F1 ATP synthase subunit gamma [Micavibrio sp.]